MITVFTPTYNRVYHLNRLYESLCQQTDKNFEWLVVDDGSTDYTEELIDTFRKEGIIEVRYIKQTNGGKHRAVNRGVREAQGSLFFIVDSDDYLCKDAIEVITNEYKEIEHDKDYCGVCGLKVDNKGEKVGGGYFEKINTTFMDFRYKYKFKGDMAEVVRTDVMREFPFPEIPGEKFCPEAVVWNRIAQKYKVRYFYKGIYICEYLPDGLTHKITKIRMQSPMASMLCYSELSKYNVPVLTKIKSAINYWRFWICGNKPFVEAVRDIRRLNVIFLPMAFLMHVRDVRNVR